MDTSRFSSEVFEAAVPRKVFFGDVTDDDYISPGDVVAIINYINARTGIETEPSASPSAIGDNLSHKTKLCLCFLPRSLPSNSLLQAMC